MKNITPAAYFTEERGSKEANEIPTYYQPYDVAHIEPYDDTDPETNSFYNLIALCKECHWKSEPRHKNAIIPKNELKELKLYWMIASGRFTRLEIDLLFDLCNPGSKSLATHTILSNNGDKILKFNLKESFTLENPNVLIHFQIPKTLISFIRNLIRQRLICYVVEDSDNKIQIKQEFTATYSLNLNNIGSNCYSVIPTEDGKAFCKKFQDIYPDL